MEHKKTKIVLDADVIIHFMEANYFSILPDIFPEYEYLILDVVYNEISQNSGTKDFIDKYLHFFHKLKKEVFSPKRESMKEFFLLQRTLGKGESACMIYCRDNRDVLGSSNLKDIKEYCSKNNITYLTTLDFLYYAYCRKKMTEQECKEFMQEVNNAGSKLPIIDIPNIHVPYKFKLTHFKKTRPTQRQSPIADYINNHIPFLCAVTLLCNLRQQCPLRPFSKSF